MIKAIIFDWVGTLYERDKGLFPFTIKVLEELKRKRDGVQRKYRLGLVTLAKSGIKAREKEIEDSRILYYFDSYIIDTEKTEKHYLQCMHELGSTPETTAIVDDRTLRGIKVGNKVGCTTFWIQNGEYANELPNQETGEPTHRINSIQDLLNFL